ncbi:MAG: hypothetical protein H6978_00605 [Gammaproteobacteria bacterium]|nr:hypothetical protein [Gammaproteobacteria bacterium]
MSIPASIRTSTASLYPRLTQLRKTLHEPRIKTMALESIRQRNALLDTVFYDVGCIAKHEAEWLSPWLAREGSIVVVPPSGGPDLRVWSSAGEFLAAGGDMVNTVVVAGVGSSALGAAAFARNVADFTGKPVAAIVSGYGLADVLTEAMGGWFWFGMLNSMRHLFENLDEATRFPQPQADLTRLSRDTATLVTLLRDRRFKPTLIAGHSKGNLVISEALYALTAAHPKLAEEHAARCDVVTISARIGMPRPFSSVIDIIGQYDAFGALNSRPDIAPELVVANAWHSTNKEFAWSMGLDVTQALRHVADQLGGAAASRSRAWRPAMADVPQLMTAALA